MEPIVERIKEIIQAQRMTNSAFAQFIGIKQATLSHTLSGRNKKPSIDLVLAIATKCGVSFNWLMEGTEKDMPNFIRTYRGLGLTSRDDTQLDVDDSPMVQNGLFDGPIEEFDVDPDTIVRTTTPISTSTQQPVDTVVTNQSVQTEMPLNQEVQVPTQPIISPEQPIHPDIQPAYQPQNPPAPQEVARIDYKEATPRKVREICIYYDDGTYEYFVPRK